MSAVLRGRAAAESSRMFYGLFDFDRNGDGIYDSFSNIEARVLRRDRQESYLAYMLSTFPIGEASILSNPAMVDKLWGAEDLFLRYEFHSSDLNIIKTELDRLKTSRVDEFVVPSAYMANRLQSLGNPHVRRRLAVQANLVDSNVFAANGPSDFFDNDVSNAFDGLIPLMWVGRFDKGKGYSYLLRCLSILPDDYVSYVVVSLEEDATRAVDFLSEAASLGVANRVRVVPNVDSKILANMYRSARKHNGFLISTSLLESFGYSVAEALACQLRVRAFDLPVWDEHSAFADYGIAVDPGDVYALAASLVE